MKLTFCLILLGSLGLAVHSVHGCSNCTVIEGKENDFRCDHKTINLCESYLKSWKVSRIGARHLYLSNCKNQDLKRGEQLLLFVSRGKLYNYGKYEVVTVQGVKYSPNLRSCYVQLKKPNAMSLEKDDHSCIVAQRFPTFAKMFLRNQCVLTCDMQENGVGGILAFKAKRLIIDETSAIDMSGKGFRGGKGGDNRGGGGYGGETFFCSEESNIGKGGDISGASWATNTDGLGGGGAGDGPQWNRGSKGGPGGFNAGGGGGDSTFNSDDGASGGGGGGHFSGGGGGGGGSGCGGHDGGKGGIAGQLGTFAGGGGQSSCPGGKGGDGGQRGNWPLNVAPHCYDKSAQGGNAGSALLGGGGGDSCGGDYGGGGGGGGLQFGNIDFRSRLSYGGGGGGGGGSAFTDDPNPGGRGGNGGGLVYLELEDLALYGKINVNGEPGECLNQIAHRSAPGGSGAGGSVVIKTKKLNGDPKGKISVSGGDPVKCAFGAGGGGGGGVGRWVVETDLQVYKE